MRVALTLLLAAVVLFPLTAGATIINIPGDYPTIQEGIDHSSDGDTVLVQPDTYYENLNFYGHNVVLASLFLMTGDTAYVSSTIIDGSSSGTVVKFANGEGQRAYIVGFTIRNGHNDYVGGGINCFRSSPTISHNNIRDNSAAWAGGGIACYEAHPRIHKNSIKGNSAIYWGGGIHCRQFSEPRITNNIISGNSTEHSGGGISSYDNSTPLILGNTIYGNSASSGGGIFCFYSNPTIRNTILWGDAGLMEIYLYGYSWPEVTYCDVEGGWSGTGNINADPIFVGPEKGDFHLRWHSPCIDAGQPSLTDPDGTRRDIGAFYFNQDVDGIIELYPHDTPIVIPPEGGDLFYDGWAFNFSNEPLTVDVWGYAFVPGSGRYGPLDRYDDVSIGVGDSAGRDNIRKRVPGPAAAGDYTYVAYIGDFPNTIIDSTYFYFTKTGLIAGGIAEWFDGEGWFKEADPEVSNLPGDYALSQNYPNPFNANTVIDYQLPVAGHVKLEVYNTLGQTVATLVNSKQQAAYGSVVWDASELSSGLYFYKLAAGDFSETKRMMLVK